MITVLMPKPIIKNLMSLIGVTLSTIALTIAITVNISPAAGALSGSQFNAGRIIDDMVFYNNNTMSVSQIQQFLNSKVPTCDTNGSAGPYYDRYGNRWNNRADYGRSQGSPPPYTCLKSYSQNIPGVGSNSLCSGSVSGGTKSAAQIIFDVAHACKINPQTLIILLQKEQSLISDDWPWPIQYRSATGYGCPDTAPCDAEYYGFFNQVYQAAKAYKRYAAMPANYNYRAERNNTIQWNPNAGCGSSNVYINNQATAGLYIYTPYRPNQAALNNLYGEGDGCSSYGNRNFWRMFNDWFGNTYATVRNGVDYSAVFDDKFYINNHADVKAAFGDNGMAAFDHFMSYGMREGRQANASFNVTTYRNRYPDLRWAFQGNLPDYYAHFSNRGKNEGRIATGTATLVPVTSYQGVNYTAVYDFNAYISKYADVAKPFTSNDVGALLHFVQWGMKEGRVGKADFSVTSYQNRYYDLRRVYGSNLPQYYLHYIKFGKTEGRISTGIYYGGVSSVDGVNYSLVYDFNTYTTNYPDIKNTFRLDDISALRHFINHGMSEGRHAIPSFNVQAYRDKNPDLKAAFGNNLKSYYLHYMSYGHKENRVAL